MLRNNPLRNPHRCSQLVNEQRMTPLGEKRGMEEHGPIQAFAQDL
jgi:hypothetical protein